MRWTVRQLREYLTVLYGGRLRPDGWYPDTSTVARRRHVSPSTVRRWIRGDADDTAPIPAKRLRALTRGYRVRPATRERERLELLRLEKMEQRARLGRGRGNLREYDRIGWLDPHVVLILDQPDRPIRRAAVARSEHRAVTRARSGYRLVHTIRCKDRFAALRIRHEILDHVAGDRIELPPTRMSKGRTQIWLAGAPLPRGTNFPMSLDG